jgi:PilZ domain
LDDFPNEPAIKDRVILETGAGPRKVLDEASIANLTHDEVWVVVDTGAVERLCPGCNVRIVAIHANDQRLVADTWVLRLVGPRGRMVALGRPQIWASSSRRANGRVRLAIPAYLRPNVGGTVASAQTTNVSVGGFHCLTYLPLSVGDQVAVSLMFTPTDPFDCLAQVVRLAEQPEDESGHRLLAAFRFVDLTAADEARVAEALAALSTDTDPTAVPMAWHSGESAAGQASK